MCYSKLLDTCAYLWDTRSVTIVRPTIGMQLSKKKQTKKNKLFLMNSYRIEIYESILDYLQINKILIIRLVFGRNTFIYCDVYAFGLTVILCHLK